MKTLYYISKKSQLEYHVVQLCDTVQLYNEYVY